MRNAGIYARYSDDEQRATSIDDQVRRAKKRAEELGLIVDDAHVYADAAITGQQKGLAKRLAYARFVKAWESNEFEAVVVDELSRLARGNLEIAHIQERVERTGVRLVTCDGIDSNISGWQLQFGMSGIIAAHFIRETSHRVKRGMQGQLERGFMIAAPPFGYRLEKNETGNVTEVGTKWVINEEAAKWVRDVFSMRYEGRSLNAIAEKLNQEGVPCPRRPLREKVAFWRPGTVHQLLANPIYRGVFVYHGSYYTRARAAKARTHVATEEFERPELRLVEDTVWFACNERSASRPFRGGGKHALAGIVSCGACLGAMTIMTGGSAPSIYCSKCAQKKRVARDIAPTVHYVSATALKRAMLHVLEYTLDDERVAELRRRLKVKLDGGQDARIAELRAEESRAQREIDGLCARIVRLGLEDDVPLEQAFLQKKQEKKRITEELEQVIQHADSFDRSALIKQLEVDPRVMLTLMFGDDVPVDRMRMVFSRVFETLCLVDRPARFVSVWKIVMCAGAVVASLTGTEPAFRGRTEFTVKVTTGPSRPTPWHVEIVSVRECEVV
jgi:site-specific DNA recombinase